MQTIILIIAALFFLVQFVLTAMPKDARNKFKATLKRSFNALRAMIAAHWYMDTHCLKGDRVKVTRANDACPVGDIGIVTDEAINAATGKWEYCVVTGKGRHYWVPAYAVSLAQYGRGETIHSH